MINSFRDKWLAQFYINNTGHRKIPANIEERLFRKLQILDDATQHSDLQAPPSNHFKTLKGKLAGQYAIRVNSRWRLIFKWHDGQGADDVYLDDHSYR